MEFFLICLAILLISFCWINTRKPVNFPPGPIWLPIIGNLQILKYLKIFKFHHLLWSYLSSIYGPIVGLKFVNDIVVIVSDKETIKDLCNREEFSGRPTGFFFRIRSFNKRLGIVFTDGHLWEEQRTFTVKTLKHLGMGKTNVIEYIQNEASELVKGLEKKIGEEMFMQNAFDISVLNVMWSLLKGERFDLDDKNVAELMKSIHDCFKIIDMSGGILNQFPFIRYIIPEKSGFLPLKRSMEPLWKFLKETITNVKESYDPKTKPKSFIECYCREIKKSTSEFYSEEQLLALSIDMFQAGSETTSNTLAFGMLYMLHYPEVMKKVQDELENICGAQNLPTLADRSKLKYTEAVICEIQRIASVAPLGIAHRATENEKLGKYIVPKNTLILCSIWSTHMDESYWKDPQNFRPERFLDVQGNIIQHENFIPFGIGKRRCVGEALAKSSLFLFFASVLHSFQIEKSSDYKLPDLTGIDGITLSPKPFKVKLSAKKLK